MLDQRLDHVSRARAQLSEGMEGGIALLQRWIRQFRNNDLHQFRYVRHDVLATNAGKLAEAHQDIRGNRGVDVAGLRQ